MKSLPSILLVAGIVVFLTACNQSPRNGLHGTELSQWVGKNVRVQLRGDALGVAAPLTVSPTTGETNGASTAIVGKLLKVHTMSLLVGDEQRPKWIPREVILFVELNP